MVTFVAADKSHPPEAKKGGSALADVGDVRGAAVMRGGQSRVTLRRDVGDAVPYGITRGRARGRTGNNNTVKKGREKGI